MYILSFFLRRLPFLGTNKPTRNFPFYGIRSFFTVSATVASPFLSTNKPTRNFPFYGIRSFFTVSATVATSFEASLPYLPPLPHHSLKVCLNIIIPSKTKFRKLCDNLVFPDQKVVWNYRWMFVIKATFVPGTINGTCWGYSQLAVTRHNYKNIKTVYIFLLNCRILGLKLLLFYILVIRPDDV